ncbi:ribosomal protein S18-alanine N-acetyltransferase [Deefgea sp. CFH1-16]|uniref:ribosomal protein S18-alanine N-acetyltransferase n=1 Tax=Deefgea sp. CFH1-16 TaxID=2675457 RepID=UPI0015F5C81C|nr:ribosomal protein S18-alanine N-acetyltransferase [Deefgea sp. CFH1-16]MBM5575195.1 ribosomal-protein-alanine N-acetyltransferase [Deefgea sp. CFH1-16]
MLKRLTEADLSAVLAIDTATNPHPWTAAQWLDSLNHHQCDGLWLQDELIGFSVCMVTLDEAELLLIAIAPQWQRQHWASQLLTALKAQLLRNGIVVLFLEVRESNQAARALYVKHDFTPSGRRKGYYPTSEGREDALLYTLHLEDKA